MKLGERIKELRNDAGLTQPELAEKANIEQSYLSKLENEKGSPSFEVITKIASALDIDTMTLVDSLDASYVQENLAHLPEVAQKLEQRKLKQKMKFRRGYVMSSFLIVIGVALIILGNSNTIFPESIYQYKSMGLIHKGEVNDQFKLFPLREIGESRDQRDERIQNNIPRINEELVLTRSYKGEHYIEGYGDKRRKFEKIDERTSESPWKDMCKMLGFICLISGGFGMGYTFKLM